MSGQARRSCPIHENKKGGLAPALMNYVSVNNAY